MAAVVLEVIIKGIDQVTGTFDKIGGAGGTLAKRMDGINQAAGNVGSAFTAAAIPIGAGILAIDRFSDKALEDERSQARLKQAVLAAGLSWETYGGQLEGVADQGMKKYAFADEQVRDALSLLIAQTGSADEAQRRLGLAMDVSRGTGLDLATTSRLVGKVTEESVNVFGRYGIKLKEGMSQQEALAEIQKRFAGQAEAFGDSNAGAMEKQKIAMDELQESIGRRLLPAIMALFDVFNSLPGGIQIAIIAFLGFGLLIAPAIAGILSLTIAVGGFIVSLISMGVALVVATGGLILIIPALIALGVAIYLFRDQIMDVFKKVKDFILDHITTIITILLLLLGPIGLIILAIIKFHDDMLSVFNAVVAFITDHVYTILLVLGLLVAPWAVVIYAVVRFHDDIINLLSDLLAFIIDTASAIGNTILNIVGAFASVIEAAINMYRDVTGQFLALLGFFVSLGLEYQIVRPFNLVRDAVQEVIDKIHELIDAIGSIPSPGDILGGAGDVIGGVLGKAAGGPVKAGQAYIVGERGAEWFVPRVSGMILPMSRTEPAMITAGSGGGTYVFNFTYSPQMSSATPAEAERFSEWAADALRHKLGH